jgi:5-deoxy-D-glucuronate isomerase
MTVNILADRMAQTRTAEANKQLCICTCHTASRSRRRCRIQQMRFARMPQTNNLQSDLRVGGSVIRAIHNAEASVAQSADDLVVVGIVLVLDRHLGVNLNTKDTSNRLIHVK